MKTESTSSIASMPVVSIVMVTWNSESYLTRCLECLKAQSYQQHELIVVDNGSSDQSVAVINRLYPGAKVILNQANIGFAGANNQGIDQSHSEYILCLNTDVFLEKNFIEELLKTMNHIPNIGVVCGKLLRTEPADIKVIDSTGLSMTPSLRSRDRGIGEIDHGQYNQLSRVFAACAAAALYRRVALNAVKFGEREYFDESFFSYYEDTDLGWRIRLAGWECFYNPKAVGQHVRGGAVAQQYSFFTKRDDFKLHTIKNRYLMMIKNLSFFDAIIIFPFLLLFEIIIWSYCLTHPRLAFRLVKVLGKHLPRVIRLRIINSRRQRLHSTKILDLLLWPPLISRIRLKFPL